MLMRVASFEIVFQEVPGEVTLALNISGCPNRCKGCHSPHLWEDIGEELTIDLLDGLLNRYAQGITCVCFMGGDQDPIYVAQLAAHIRARELKSAWYSGKRLSMSESGLDNFDFVKTGPYIESLGGLKSTMTNQRFYRREANRWIDDTARFRKKGAV